MKTPLRLIAQLAVLALTVSILPSCQRTEAGFEIHHGINISNAFHVTVGSDDCTFHPEEVDSIAAAGFDFVRIPIDEKVFFAEDLQPVEPRFAILRQAIDQCLSYGIRVVLDLHVLRSHSFLNDSGNALFSDESAQERFCDIWRQISAHVGDYPTAMVAYELLNEAVADTDEQWNAVFNMALRTVRSLEPERMVILSPNKWQAVSRIKNMDIPADEHHAMISFHFYTPMMLSHYGASWTGYRDVDWQVHYPGQMVADEDLELVPERFRREAMTVFNKEKLEEYILEGVEAAKAKGLPLYLGEFGVIADAPLEDAVRWYKDVIDICDKYAIPHSAWAYSGRGFGTFDKPEKKAAVVPVLTGRR